MLAHREQLLDAAERGQQLAQAVQGVGLVRVEGERLPEGVLGRHHPALHHLGVAERHESLGAPRIELRGAPCQRVAARDGALDDLALLLRHAAAQRGREQRGQRIAVSQHGVGRREIRVAHQHLFQDHGGIGQGLRAARARRHLGAQEIQIGVEAAGTAVHQGVCGTGRHLERNRDLAGDDLLDVEDAGKRRVIVLRPQLRAVARLHQLDVHAHALGRHGGRALHEVARIERLADGLDVARRRLELERGRARHHAEARAPRSARRRSRRSDPRRRNPAWGRPNCSRAEAPRESRAPAPVRPRAQARRKRRAPSLRPDTA